MHGDAFIPTYFVRRLAGKEVINSLTVWSRSSKSTQIAVNVIYTCRNTKCTYRCNHFVYM